MKCRHRRWVGSCAECSINTCLDCHEQTGWREEITTAVVWCIECHWAEAQAHGLPMWRAAALVAFDPGDEDRRAVLGRTHDASEYVLVRGTELVGMEAR